MLTQAALKKLLNYDPETGIWTWIRSPRKNLANGSIAGTVLDFTANRGGLYRSVTIKGKHYLSHRLAFLYMTGSLPVHYVDHIDGDSSNDRWINLRDADTFQNSHNKRVNKTSTTGLKGAEKHRDKWTSRIYVRGKRIYLGQFNCPTAAHFAYMRAAKKHFGEFASNRK